eukprot:ANDGO_08067.mRNA.1 ATP-dependent DNA helicase II subunit 1
MSWYEDSSSIGGDDGTETVVGGDSEQQHLLEDVEFSSRDAVVFLIDCRLPMFPPLMDLLQKEPNATMEQKEKLLELEDVKAMRTPIQKTLLAVASTYSKKILSAENDRVAVLFFGAQRSKNHVQQEGVYVLQDLDVPSAERIIELENLAANPLRLVTVCDFGKPEQVKLAGSFYVASLAFSKLPKTWDFRRIFLLTYDLNPCVDFGVRNCLEKMRDMLSQGVLVNILPLVADPLSFAKAKFWSHVLKLTKQPPESDDSLSLECDLENEDAPVKIITSSLEDIVDSMNKQTFRKRALTTFPLSIPNPSGRSFDLSVSVYTLVRKATKPRTAVVKVDDFRNVSLKTNYISIDTGEVMDMAAQGGKEFMYGGSPVTFLHSELALMNISKDDPKITVLAFVEASFLRSTFHSGHCSFLYPNEKKVSGSTRAFIALWARMLQNKRIAIARIVRRRSGKCMFVALVPQDEVLDPVDPTSQVAPPGMCIVPLPYSSEFRSLDLGAKFTDQSTPTSATKQSDAVSRRLVDRLSYDYKSGQLPNPALARFLVALQHRALQREGAPELPSDLTYTSSEHMERKAKTEMEEFARHFFPPTYNDELDSATRSKAAKTEASESRKRARAVDVDSTTDDQLRELMESQEISRMTVAQIKELLKPRGILTTGKKDDLIQRLTVYLSTAPSQQ